MQIILQPLLGALLAGLGLGLFYFGGLWWTVQRVAGIRHPALLLVGSYVVRTLLVVVSFYLVMCGSWLRLLACLAGFLAMRTLLTAGFAFMSSISSSTTEAKVS